MQTAQGSVVIVPFVGGLKIQAWFDLDCWPLISPFVELSLTLHDCSIIYALFVWVFLSHSITVGFAEIIFSSWQIDTSASTFKSRHHVTLKSCHWLSMGTEKLFCLPGCQGVTPLLSCGQNGFMILKCKWLVEFFKEVSEKLACQGKPRRRVV